MQWNTPDVGRDGSCVAQKGFVYSYSRYTILSLPTDVSVYGCTIPIYLHALTEAAAGAMLAVGRVVGVAAVQLAVLADGAALVVRVRHIQSLYSVGICSR